MISFPYQEFLVIITPWIEVFYLLLCPVQHHKVSVLLTMYAVLILFIALLFEKTSCYKFILPKLKYLIDVCVRLTHFHFFRIILLPK